MKILSYRKNEKEGALLGYFSMEYTDMFGIRFINSCKLFRNKNTGNWFITMPDREYESEGVKKYSAYTGYTTREGNELFQNEVIKCLKEFFDSKAKSDQTAKFNIRTLMRMFRSKKLMNVPFKRTERPKIERSWVLCMDLGLRSKSTTSGQIWRFTRDERI